MDEVFAPPTERWIPVSPKLRTVRRIVLLVWVVPLTLVVATTLGSLVASWLGIAVAVVAALLTIWEDRKSVV